MKKQPSRQQAQTAREIVESSCGEYLKSRSAYRVELIRLLWRFGVVECGPAELDVDGYLVRRGMGFTIRYSRKTGRLRQRFTVAHELAHIMLAQHNGELIDESRRSFGVKEYDEVREETLCDMIAAELLMPTNDVWRILCSGKAGWSAVYSIASAFDVSLTAATRRVLSIPGALAVWTLGKPDCNMDFSVWVSSDVERLEMSKVQLWKSLCDVPQRLASSSVPVLYCGKKHLLPVEVRPKKSSTFGQSLWGFGWGFSY